jgi:hypothetical protein
VTVFSLVLSVYGAGLATYLATLRRRELTRRLKLIYVYMDPALPYFAVTIVNSGQRRVHVDRDGFVLDDGSDAEADYIEQPEGSDLRSAPLPKPLADTDDCPRLLHLARLTTLDSLPAYYVVRDNEGREWRMPVPEGHRRWVAENRGHYG